MHGLSVLARLKPRRPIGRILKIPSRLLRVFEQSIRDAYTEGYVDREIEVSSSKTDLNPKKSWEKSDARAEIVKAKNISRDTRR